ncbi:MAG: anaerobic ribonucleoside-triphosphate reductase [Candidatus Nanohaloarchaeota archaeon QJJ-7]|nr:anaerobic ribonucleoside-triphosphate reductase [Candidatus Nanohaloarchaeota archaeon QJJ-7]
MTVECKECGWEGDEDVLEYFKCPSCGSRNLKTEGGGMTESERKPPENAMQGGMSA